ncbi:acyltransferase [Tenacibaculum sp. S7007]|uniref:Acyltransferase n=1 Tax=Tenacibaculum pelagium TaxID=2759527 RepID=A0A839AMG4_9FLAO|nr:acyltransferase [Tenacibaculum pelagium]MBA6156292.1 acyltransferase [Tenacibaculum pelagium]
MNRVFRYVLAKLLRLLPLISFPKVNVSIFRSFGYDIDKSARIYSSVSIFGNIGVKIGARTHIGNETIITGGNAKIFIGKDCDISDRVSIVCGTHEIAYSGNKAAGKGIGKDIVIGNGVWIGYGALILPGVKIGDKAIVGAGCVVSKDVLERQVVIGNPMRVIKNI